MGCGNERLPLKGRGVMLHINMSIYYSCTISSNYQQVVASRGANKIMGGNEYYIDSFKKNMKIKSDNDTFN